MRTIALVLAFCTAFPVAAAEMFRGGPEHKGVYSGTAPRGAFHVLWAAHTDGPVRSSPAVDRDNVYVGSGDGRLYAIARTTGRIVWTFEAGGPVNGSPAVDDRLVFISSGNGFLSAVDRRSGKLQWRVETGSDAAPRWGWEYFAGSPTLAGNSVYAGGVDGRLRAIDAADGRILWTTPPLGGKVISSPAVSGGLVLVGSDSGKLSAFDRTTGAPRWTFETAGVKIDLEAAGFDRRSIHSSPAIDGDEVVIGGRDGFLYGVSLADGKERWRIDHKAAWVVASAAMWNGLAIVGTSDGKNVEAVDRSGKIAWSAPTADRVFSSSAVAGATAYVGCHDGSLLVFDAATGTLLSRFWIGAPITSSPVLRDGIVYVGADDGNLYALEAHGTAAPPLHRAVYWRDDRPSRSPQTVRLRDYLQHAGYELLDPGKLALFMKQRIADRQPGVIVFATERIPAEVGAEPSTDSLAKEYLEAGGRIAWYGLPPYSIVFDAATGKPKALDLDRAKAFLGVSFHDSVPDDVPARPTAAGVSRNLRGWWIGTQGISPAEVTEVLGTDEYGRAVTWSKRIGSGEFLMLGAGTDLTMSLADLVRLIETPGR